MQLFFYLNALKPSPKPDLTFVAGGPSYKWALGMSMQGYANTKEAGLVPGSVEEGRALCLLQEAALGRSCGSEQAAVSLVRYHGLGPADFKRIRRRVCLAMETAPSTM